LALAIVVAIAVLREGSEVVLFLYGVAAAQGGASWSMVAGGFVGLLLGCSVCLMTYLGLITIPTRYLFSVTSALIALLAAGMAAQAIAFLEQADIVTALDQTVWDTSWILSDSSFLGRALHTLIDALGGNLFHQGRDEVIGAAASYVALADSVLQVASPDQGTAAYADWTTTAPNDTYHSLTFKVADLDRAAEHLKSQGVGIRSRTEDTLVTDPETSLNVPWGFTTALVPGDPRA